MNTSKHLTITALLTFLALAALGCDSAIIAEDAVAQQSPTFATHSSTPETVASTPVDEAVTEEDEAVTLEDLAHTATTVGEMMAAEVTEEPATDEPAIEEAVTEETIVEQPADEPVDEPATEPAPEPIAEIFSQGSEPVTWSPNGTFKLPAYGSGCRFTTDTVIQIPSNGSVDDSILFAADSGPNATFELVVETPSGMTVNADVEMMRGLTGRSYRQAAGEATWSDKTGDYTGQVVDGTLCFDAKLANGLDDVLAEFSLIIELDGLYYTMGGNVLIEGDLVTVTDNFIVEAPSSVDIDLR